MIFRRGKKKAGQPEAVEEAAELGAESDLPDLDGAPDGTAEDDG